MVVATVAPNFDAFAVLLLRWRCLTPGSLLVDCRLPEHAKIRCFVLLPVPLVDLVGGSSEDPNANDLPVDPVALECGHVGPDELAVATLVHLIVYSGLVTVLRVVSLLESVLLVRVYAGYIACLVHSH